MHSESSVQAGRFAMSTMVGPWGPAILLLVAVCSGVAAPVQGHDLARELFDASVTLRNSLDESQQQKLCNDFASELRTDWQFVPMEREGLGFFEMRPDQRLLATSLIQTALSHRGFSQTVQIMALEQVLHEIEKQNPKRDPSKYHLFFFGEPSLTESWGWRIEGHHLSISFTIVDGQTVVTTPAFFGANPAEVRAGPQAGMRVLGAEEDAGRQLVKNLSVEQKRSAIISQTAPKDIINGPGRAAASLEPAGIAVSEMSETQRDQLRKLIGLYVHKFRPELARDDLAKIETAGFEKICFAWAGELLPGKPHYFRIQGPTFIMEYDNTQNGANHAHTVWRDFQNDFGADLLKQHYQTQPHGDGQ